MDVLPTSADRRGVRGGRGHGARARAGGHSRRGRRRAYGRPDQDPRDPGGRVHPGHGQGADRALRRGADPRGARGRLRRRERVLTPADEAHHIDKWAHPVRRGCPQPGRGAAPRARRGHDPHQGRGGHGRHRQRGSGTCAPSSATSPMGTLSEELYTEAKELQAPVELVRWVAENGACRSSPSPPAASRRRPTRPACSSARTACSSAPGSSSPPIPLARAKAIVEATTHFSDPETLARVSTGLGEPMRGLDARARAGRAARDPRLVAASAGKIGTDLARSGAHASLFRC